MTKQNTCYGLIHSTHGIENHSLHPLEVKKQEGELRVLNDARRKLRYICNVNGGTSGYIPKKLGEQGTMSVLWKAEIGQIRPKQIRPGLSRHASLLSLLLLMGEAPLERKTKA